MTHQRAARTCLCWLIGATAGVVALSVAPRRALAQTLAPGQWGVFGEAGAVATGTWVTGRGAPDVQSTLGPALSLGARRSIGSASSASLALRLLSQPLSLREGAQTWSGGTLVELQPMLTLSTQLPLRADAPVAVEGGLGVSVLSGARSLYPFSNAARVAPVGDLGLAYAFSPRRSGAGRGAQPDRPLAAFVRYSVLRFDPGVTAGIDANRSESGWVSRISAGIRVQR